LEGLGERWGSIDRSLNPDLNDIAASYRQHSFLVYEDNGNIIGVGALLIEHPVAQLVRISVRKERRRLGIGGRVVPSCLQKRADEVALKPF